MSTITVERFKSREITHSSNSSQERLYLIKGSDDEAEVLQALTDEAPATISVEGFDWSRSKRHIEQVGWQLWEGTVTYVPPSRKTPEVGESTYQFDTGGGTQHITQSLQNIGQYAASGETAPDFQGAIGVTHDSVEGVDITVPVFNFSESHYMSDFQVSQAYKLTLFNLTGKVNSGSFKGFAAGEVLFLGASGSRTGDDKWEITFNFAASKNATNLSVGGITIPSKKGWEYLWVRYADTEDTSAKRVVKKPIAAYVEKVYEDGNFSELGI